MTGEGELIVAALLAVSITSAIAAEQTVDVKYRGPVSLAPFACEAITRSSFIENVC
ncbi:MAG: hypothetical protein USCAAHI_01966 [Beijerinckiaceae bacterium]|nr:MAG: hypothetical protein USCAAHI_01966 [Beijerinckiaceae bacterium]